MQLIKRTIMIAVWQALIVVMLVVMGIFFIVLLIGDLSNIGTAHYGIGIALIHSFLLLPSQLYALLPMLGFLAALLGLGRLSSQNELIAIRAAGYSRWQITWSVMQASILVIILITWIGERYSYHWMDMANSLKNHAMQQKPKAKEPGHFWVRGNHAFIYVEKAIDAHTLKNVTVFHFNDQSQVTQMIHADIAHAKKSSWQLDKVSATQLGKKHVTLTTASTQQLAMDFKPSYLEASNQDPSQLSIQHLWHVMLYRWDHHLSPNQLSFAFWLRVFQPLNTLLMIWLGIPFVFGSLRHATMGYRIIVGIMLGFGLYMLNQVIGPLCMLYQWPPLIAAIIPSLLLLAFGIYLLRSAN
jgi:lipopolysaccharide export system permease protein